MRVALHRTAMAVAVAWLAMANIPVEVLWFDPREPEFTAAVEGTAPEVSGHRWVPRPTIIAYSTVTRDAETGAIVCEGNNGEGFAYQITDAPYVNRDLVWWSNGDLRCGRLKPGTYWTETTWTIPKPARALLPPWLKGTILAHALPEMRIERTSPTFRIYAVEESRRLLPINLRLASGEVGN